MFNCTLSKGEAIVNEINPIKLAGMWDDGYALDYHTVYSTYEGVDEYGHKQFETKRTNLGELLYSLKYKGEKAALNKIKFLIKPFLLKWNVIRKVNAIITIPPSNQWRKVQPVYEVGKIIGEIINQRVYN